MADDLPTPETISRQEARLRGLKRYFTGKPCKNGHIAERQVSNWTCLRCYVAINARKYCKDPTKHLAQSKAWTAAHPDKTRTSARKRQTQYRLRHLNVIHQRARANQPAKTLYNSAWFAANPGKHAQYNADRRAAQNQPAWADKAAIAAFYAACSPGMTVDHQIPLKGKNVCGLHIASNLQYLSLSDNSSKGSTFAD